MGRRNKKGWKVREVGNMLSGNIGTMCSEDQAENMRQVATFYDQV